MKRVITTKLIVWIAAVALILTGLFAMASCNRTEIQDNVTYKLNLDNFDGIATYGEPVDLSNITIIATENGVSTEVPIDVSMVTSHIDPNRVGAQLLKFNYAGRIFSVPFTVLYKIQYEFQGIVLKTFHVLTSSELEEVVAPEKPGYNFVGWSEEIPDIIFENMTLSAEYELIVPELPTFNATYGDSLLDIDLPSTIAGAWRFDTDAETVGDAGKKTFPVKFIENATGEVAATDTVTVDVARKEIVFSDIVDRFVYNGAQQLPTYKTDVDVKVSFWADGDKNYTDAGEYSYHFEVDDPNYTGEAKGTFVIEPAVVTVKIGSYTILASEPFPEVEYEVIGFDNFELLGLTVTKPEDVAIGVGTFTLTATTSNPSIELVVEEGTITVNTAILEVAPPELSSVTAIYGDLIDTITFPTHPNGKWSWETPGVEVGDAGKQTHIAVFTPTDSRYEPSKVAMEITVKPRELVIEVDNASTNVNYNGKAHSVSFVVKEQGPDGEERPDLEVIGNTAYTNAGSYNITLTVADPNYTATKTVILKINKIDPEVTFDQVYEVIWSETLMLADIKLPKGFAWEKTDVGDPSNTSISNAGTHFFKASYTPDDQENYNKVFGQIQIKAAKASVTINGASDYTKVYDTQEYDLPNVTASNDATLTVVITKNGEVVDRIVDEGEYTVTYSFAGDDNYLAAETSITVTVQKATTKIDDLTTDVDAIYGDLVFDKIQLPEGIEGTWSILDADETTTVGNVGINTFTVAFTCTTGNYEDREVTITVNVAKKKIDAPSIPEGFGSQVYTGELLTSGLVGKEGYTVTDEGGIDVGTYTVTVALVSDNYIWSDDTSDDLTLTYTITKAENEWVEAPAIGSWVYGEAGDFGSAVAKVGDVKIEYLVNGIYTTELPTEAGAYVARFTATDSNHLDLVTTCEFVIEKATVEVPTIADDKLVQVYTGSVLTSGLEGNALYTVTDEGGKNAATYTAVLSLADKANYKWDTTGESEDVQLKYTVSKAQIVVEEFAIEGWTFGQAENAPTYKTNFFYRVSFVYATAPNGEFVKDVPVAAGTYYAKAIFEGNENLIGAESEAVEFTISKASVTIENANNGEKVYDTKEYVLPNVTASNDATLTVVITKNGVVVEEITDAGTYTVTYSFAGDDNYQAAEKSITVTVKKATNTETVLLKQNAVYGNTISVITLPAGVEGYWSIKEDATTVGNAGTNTFTAIFTCTTGNYNDREVEFTVTVAKKQIDAPSIFEDFSSQVYTGEVLTSGLVSGEGYTVIDEGGIDVGTYTVKVALESNNYEWSDPDIEATFDLTYTITKAENEWVEAPAIGSWVYGEAGDFGSAVAKVGDVKIEYLVNGIYTTELPTEAGTYTARFTVIDSNYNDLVATCTFTIQKATVEAPSIAKDKLAQVYTGNILTSGLTATERYTVVDNGGKNVATYIATISLADKANYKWDTTGNSDDIRLSYAITKAQIVITEFAIDGWTFGQNANVPTYTVNFASEVSYVYATAMDGDYTATVPTAAGTYYVKAIAQGNENLIGVTSEAAKFTIAKAGVTINNAKDDTKVYDTKEYSIPSNIIASNNAPLTIVITKNGEVVDKIVDAGEYTVTFSLEESDNYLAAEESITVTVTRATNNETVITGQSAVYGNAISVITLPAGVEGSWSIQGATADTKVGNAGINTFTAVFTCTTGNYNDREVVITVNVAKATIGEPIVADKKYDGQYHNSGLTDTTDYVITEDIGGTDHGIYTVTVTLTDPANYKWETSADASITIEYEISAAVNEWEQEPTITPSWEYESAGDLGQAKALHGGVLIEYKPEGADDSAYSTTLPTLPGKYIARFTSTDDNYTILKVTKGFEITKRKITPPTQTQTGFVYNGSLITSGIVGNDFFTVEDAGAINVQSGIVVTVTLTSEHYVWADGVDGLAREYTYAITKANIAITDPVIEGWTYGDDANAPTSTNNFNQVVTYVYASTINGAYTDVVPSGAGTYYVKAIAQGNDNLNYSESAAVSFTIKKATATIEGEKDAYEAVYNKNGYTIEGVYASNGEVLKYTYTKNGENVSGILNAGEYTVVITLDETANYLGDSVTVTVKINKVVNEDEIPAYTATYGDLLSTLTVPTSEFGTWKWQNADALVGNAGVQTHKLVFVPDDAENYAERTADATVTVSKKVINTPAAPADRAYTNTLYTSGLIDTDLYTVVDAGGTANGTYTATLTLTDPDNYVWDNGTDTTTVSYTITKGENALTNVVMNGWTYDKTGHAGSATAKYGDVLIEYLVNGEYTTEVPVNAGTYTARFTTTDPNCDPVSTTRTFTIEKAVVTTPSVEKDKIAYTGNTITSGLSSTDVYTVTDAGGINVDDYTVTVTLKDEKNYKWNTTGNSEAITLSYSIIKANINVTVTIDGWTYGEDAKTPNVTTDFDCDVTVKYSTAQNGEYTEAVPTNAGTYYVKAFAKGNDNLNDSESAAVSFVIAKKAATIEGVKNSYTAVYNKEGYDFFADVYASNGLELDYTFTKNGQNVSEILNAGEYTVVITLDASANYTGDTVTVTVSITKVQNTDTIPTYTATYGDALSTLAPPTSANGTWKWQNASDLVGNAGNQTHKLVFVPNDSENYADRTADATVTVSKKVINTPAAPADRVYTNTLYTSGLSNTDLYTVVDAGGKAKGTYTATLTLTDPDNYVWDNGTATTTVSYTITKGTNELSGIVMNGWTYDGTGHAGSATAKYGDVKIEYKLAGADDSAYTTTVPVNAGSYVARFTTTDPNCDPISTTRTFTVAKLTVSKPSIAIDKQSQFYTGATLTSGLVTGDRYTVVDAGGVDAGSYTVKISLKDKINTEWNDKTTDDLTLSYTINKVSVSITLSTPSNAIYNGSAQHATYVVTPSTATVVLKYQIKNADGVWVDVDAPINAGTYRVVATVTETTNFFGATAEKTFNIGKATPTWSDPSFAGGTFYQNRFAPSTSGWKAMYGNTEVAGQFAAPVITFTGENGAFVDATENALVTVTFTPQDTVNYVSNTVSYKVTFVAVAFLNNTTPYGTIEAAVADATSGDVVWVRPHNAGLGPIYIMEDITIREGVTLLLPYGVTNDKFGRNQWTGDQPFFELHGGGCTYDQHKDGGKDYRAHTANEGHYPSELDPNKCIVKVILAAGKTITNNGILEIGGELSGGGAHAQYAGFTAGKHATLVLDAGAKIISENGSKIYAAGFIRETGKDNGSEIVINSGATLFQPYALKDFRDGSYMVAAQNGMKDPYYSTAYNRFVMMNVAPTLKIYYGGVMGVWASLFTGSTQANNTTTQNFIGCDTVGTDAVIVLTKSYSYLVAKYDPATEICDLKIYGGAKTQVMKLSVKMGTSSISIPITVTTQNCFFPLTYHYNITLGKSDLKDENGNLLQGADEIAVFDMGQRFKLMTGASLTIEKGARANFGTLIVYENFVDNCAYHNAHYRYPNQPAAKLTVNGELVCGTFGGKIYSTGEGASVTINSAVSCTAYEIANIKADSFSSSVTEWNIIAETAQLINNNATAVLPGVGTTCIYANGEWITSLTVNFNSNGGDAFESITMSTNETYPELPTPTRTHYIFVGWMDADGKIVSQGNALPTVRDAVNGNTLTAQWTPVEYKLNYEWKFEGFDTNPTITWAESLGTFNIESAAITLPTLTNATGTLVGWYTDAACENLIKGSISGADLIALWNGDATVYGLWTNQQYTVKFEGDVFDDIDYTNDTVVYTPTTLPSAVLPTIPDSYQTDTTKNKYFVGWYYNGNLVTDFSFVNQSTSGEYTLTAKWIDKVSITYTANNTSIYTNLITNGSETLTYGTIYWYKPGTSITLANVTANDNVVTDSSKLNYCKSLTLNGVAFDKSNANTAYTLSANTVIHITWGTKTTVKVDYQSKGADQNNPSAVDAVYKLLVSSTGTDDGQYSTNAAFVTNKDTTYYVIPEHYIKFEVTSCIEDGTTVPRDSWTAVTETTYVIYNRPKYQTCIVEGTLITLADGTQKKVEDLTREDMLLIFNHETGKMEAGYVAMLDHLEMDRMWANVINFTFSNGETLRMVWNHGVFDVTLNKYVLVGEDNYSEFVGHKFYSTYYNGTEFVSELVTLTDAFITNEYIRVYNPTSYWHMNYFSNGILNVTAAPADHVGGHVNIFELDEDMKYDVEQMQADIEKYGLYTYDDFAEYLTEEQFSALPFAYLKVAVGKGNIDWESIMQIVEYIKVGSLLD